MRRFYLSIKKIYDKEVDKEEKVAYMKNTDIPGLKTIDELIDYLKKQEMRKCLTADYLNNVDDYLSFKNKEASPSTQSMIDKIFSKLKIIYYKCKEESQSKQESVAKITGIDKGR